MSERHDDIKARFEQMCSQLHGFDAVSVCFAATRSKKDVPQFRKLQLSDQVSGTFRDIAIQTQQRYLQTRRNVRYEFKDYAAESKPDDHEIEYLDLAHFPDIKQQIALLKSLADIDDFSERDKTFISQLRFYVIVLQLPGEAEPLYFFRLYSNTKILGHSKKFGLIWRSGHYDKVTEPIITFDEEIDCICWGTSLFILKKDNFHRIFYFFEHLQKAAQETLEFVRANIPIANFDRLAADCQSHTLKLAKLRNIMGKPYAKKITMADIKKVIARRNLPIQTTSVGGCEMIVYDPSDPWTLLKLLDDDYLTSLMTDLDYEVSGKRELG
jgi:hypothetical protein